MSLLLARRKKAISPDRRISGDKCAKNDKNQNDNSPATEEQNSNDAEEILLPAEEQNFNILGPRNSTKLKRTDSYGSRRNHF